MTKSFIKLALTELIKLKTEYEKTKKERDRYKEALEEISYRYNPDGVYSYDTVDVFSLGAHELMKIAYQALEEVE